MQTFSVRNFEKFQHYKDRNPPWIKLYNEVLDDYEFGSLPDASKAHLLAIWLLASRTGNRLPFDPEWIRHRINATEPVNLALLAERKFIVVDQVLQQAGQDASAAIHEAPADARPETEQRQRREEAEESGAGAPPAKQAKATRLDERWQPSADLLAWAKTEAPNVDLRRETERFRNYWLTKPKDATKLDWGRTWQNWMSKAQDDKPAQRRNFAEPAPSIEQPWERRVENFKQRNIWVGTWGPPPDQPGCFAPKPILKQYGYGEAA